MIVFHNVGLIPLEAFTSFGVNAKPMSENPIGYFGTGLKYAVAVTLRLGGKFRFFRGTEEYEFYVKETDFRGKSFEMVRMRRRKGILFRWQYFKMPFTTELGKDWKPWMAVRELESNCRDENGESYLTASTYEDGDENCTRIIIECTEMEEAYENLDSIFMPKDKKLLDTFGTIEIREGSSKYLFYRDLRVLALDRPSLFTYNYLDKFDLTEDRTAKYEYYVHLQIMEAIQASTNTDIIQKVVGTEGDAHYESSLPWDQTYSSPSVTFMSEVGARVAMGRSVPKRMMSYYESLSVDPDDKFISLSMRARYWKMILKMPYLPDEVKIRIQGAMKNEGLDIPF